MIELNIIWPALFKTENLPLSSVLILLSVLIEAVFIYLINRKGILRAVWISALINIVSAVFGYVLLLLLYDMARTLVPFPATGENQWIWVCVLIVSTVISTLIESFIYIQLWQGRTKTVVFWLSIGNLVTYVVTYLFVMVPV